MFKRIALTVLLVGSLISPALAGGFSSYTKEYVSPDGTKHHMITTVRFMGRTTRTHVITVSGYDKNGNFVCNSYSYTE